MPRRPTLALSLVLPLALALVAACSDSAGPAPADPADAVYASELGIDLAAMTKTASGLYLQDVVVGTGATAQVGQTVTVHYTGWFPNGTQFDSSREDGVPLPFDLVPGDLIDGWVEGVPGMRVGGRRKLVIPPQLGFGSRGSIDGHIPGNAILVFDIELLGVQ